jgi:hypothetical protein
MKRLMTQEQGSLFKKRSIIETVWDVLKERYNLVYHPARNMTGLFRHYCYSLVSYLLKPILQQSPSFPCHVEKLEFRPVKCFLRDRKKDDTMIFTRGSLGRLNMTANGITVFSMPERYFELIAAALETPAEGRDFSTGWQPGCVWTFEGVGGGYPAIPPYRTVQNRADGLVCYQGCFRTAGFETAQMGEFYEFRNSC